MAKQITKGDRVIACTDLGKGVRKGEIGVVTDTWGFSTDRYEVSFDGTKISDVTDKDIARV